MSHSIALKTASFTLPTLVILAGGVLFGLNPTNKYLLFETEKTIITVNKNYDEDVNPKTKALKEYLTRVNSPLLNHASVFVEVADTYGLDYKLLPAIACMESSCGKFLIPGTYNPFGWGIYGNNYISFKNYTEAINTVAKGIHENYVSKGYDTPEEIAPIYTPPNHTKWLSGVNYFMNQIEKSFVSNT